MSESLFGTEISQSGSPIRKEGALEYVREGTLVISDIEKVPSYLQSRLVETLKTGNFMREGGRQIIPFKGRIVVTTSRPPKNNALEKFL